MFQSARWCVETFQLKQLIVFHFLFQVCDPLSRTASVTTVSRSNHLLVLYKVTCNQKGFYRNHQLRKLPTSTFQQVIWLSLRCCCATWAVFDCCLLVAALRLRTNLVFWSSDFRFVRFVWHLVCNLWHCTCLTPNSGFVCVICYISFHFTDCVDWTDWTTLSLLT